MVDSIDTEAVRNYTEFCMPALDWAGGGGGETVKNK